MEPASRTKKSGLNAFTGVLQNVTNLVLTFVSRIIFVRILDASYLGINGLFSNILGVLALADLGMSTAMMYSLYKPIADDDKEKITSLINFYKKIYLTIATVVLVVGLLLIPLLPYLVNLEEPVEFLNGYYVLALLNVVVSYLFIYRTTLLQADQKSYILNNYILAFRVITFAVQTIVLVVTKDYFIYLLAALIISFISNLTQNHVTMKRYPYLKNKGSKLNKSDKRSIANNVKDLFLYKVCATVQGNTDNILISVMVGTIYVGYYSNYYAILTAIAGLINVIFNALKASVGNLIASNDSTTEHKLFIYWVLELADFWIVGFCSVCFICLYQDCIYLFFGEEYVLPMIIVIAVVLNFYTNNIRQTMWAYRETTGIFHDTRFITAVTAVLNIVFSLILGYFWGMFGILIATVIARMLYAWWREPLILFKKYFGISAKKYLLTYIGRALLCILTTAVTFFVCSVLPISNLWLLFICKMVVCAILPNIVFFLVFYRKSEFKFMYEKTVKVFIQKVTSHAK